MRDQSDIPRPEDLLTDPQVAGLLGIDTSTLWRWRTKGVFPGHDVRPNGLRFRRTLRATVVKWLEDNRMVTRATA